MSSAVIREAPGWSYALCRAECDDCNWTGPVRNTDNAHENALLTVDKRRHQCDDDQEGAS